MKSPKWYRRRHKTEWRRQQVMIQYPWMADMERRNAEFEKIAVAWLDTWALLVKAFEDASQQVCDDWAEALRSVRKTG